jgi:hypothetical protein
VIDGYTAESTGVVSIPANSNITSYIYLQNYYFCVEKIIREVGTNDNGITITITTGNSNQSLLQNITDTMIFNRLETKNDKPLFIFSKNDVIALTFTNSGVTSVNEGLTFLGYYVDDNGVRI